MIELYDHQLDALDKLENGSILRGGVGSGKSLTSIAYFIKVCGGDIYGDDPELKNPRNLYIITTAQKRDLLDWDRECLAFNLSTKSELNKSKISITIDSWQNIKKYIDVENSFFIFDEQRVVGYGAWSKAFIKIAKKNKWILLSATPGDVWKDYIPVFVANGFYRNKTEFERSHVVYKRFSKFPQIDYYIGTATLLKYRKKITVEMPYTRNTKSHHIKVYVEYDKEQFEIIEKKKWDIYNDKPIKQISQAYYIMRKLVNSDWRRIEALVDIFKTHKKMIIFYNFNYELDILRDISEQLGVDYGEWNGHKHEPIPNTDEWFYLVQYTAGAEGWNCVDTDTIVFYSQNYSYKIMKQAAGRIDRLNTKFVDLYYYHLLSRSFVDLAIRRALDSKQKFQELEF